MDIKRLDTTPTWNCYQQIEQALHAQPQQILAGLEVNDAYIYTILLAFKYADNWSLLYDSQLTFATQAEYYGMVDVSNSLSTYAHQNDTDILIHTSPYDSFAGKEPKQVLAAMQDECYMTFNKRNFKI